MRCLVLPGLVACAAAPLDDGDTDVADPTDAFAWAPGEVATCLGDAACQRILVVAHRGFHRDVPENTLASVTAAADLGVQLAEVDVRVTSDGALVVLHDPTVDRTTDGSGEVEALTLAEVEALTVAGGTDAASSRVPTFDAVLAEAVARGLGLYVDTKTSRVDLVVDAIVAAGAEDLAVVYKGWPDVAPAVEAGLRVIVPIDTLGDLATARGDLPDTAFVEIDGAVADPVQGAAVQAVGLRVQQDVFLGDGPWVTVGSSEGWAPYLAAGVQMAQAEHPDGLLAALRAGELPGRVQRP